MQQQEIIKRAIGTKLTILLIVVLALLFVYFKLEYGFTHMIFNAILLYLFSVVFKFIFTFNSLHIFLDIVSPDFEPDIEEFKAREMELRFEYPKLYAYNQFVLFMYIAIKILAILMFIYGVTQLIFVDS